MKNKRQKSNRHELKKARELRNVALTLLAVVLVTIAAVAYMGRGNTQAIQPEPEIENYIRSKVTEKQISPGREPVALYYRSDGTSEKFLCVGTVVIDRHEGTVIMTSEHAFRVDRKGDQIISIKPLRRCVHQPTYYVEKVIKDHQDLGGQDAVMLAFNEYPTPIRRFSKHLGEMAQNYYSDVIIRNKKIPWLQSLVSGEKFNTFGYSRKRGDTNSPISILIDCYVRPGESGTGFIDQYGGLWLLHGSADDPERLKLMRNEYESLTHKTVTNFSAVSGPFGGHYD